MNRVRTLPNDAVHDLVSFTILVDGEAVNPGLQVMSIVICKEVNRIPTARMVLRDGDAAAETFELSNTPTFVPGKKIVIKVGRDSVNELLFRGIIIKQSVSVKKNGQSNLVIECRDEAVKMTIGRKNRYYENLKDSQIIEQLISNYSGLSPDVEETGLMHKELVQHHAADWDLLVSRAERNGKLVIVDDGKIQVKAPDTSQSPVISVLYGATLYAFEAEMDARTQWNTVKANAWDYANQRLFETESSSVDFGEHGNLSGTRLSETIGLEAFEIRHSGQLVEEELQAWSDACLLRSRLAKIRGRAHILVGNSDLKPGKTIDLQGVGDRFSGSAYITAVRHEIIAGQWDAQLQFGLLPHWQACKEEVVDYPAAGLVPGVNGLQIGKVVQLQSDPDGEDRILVRLPIIDNQAPGIWCRVASLDAGQNRGTFFRPEIDDEVIVGFINDDPRDAIVLGMLHSSAKPAPLTAEDINNEKGIFTRENMRLHFHDGTKTITIDTPGGNSIKLDEAGMTIDIKDQNGNNIKMSPSGIDIESPMNINIKAGAALALSAGTTLAIGATSISVSADGAVSMEGATAKLAGQGITEVSGSLVKIN